MSRSVWILLILLLLWFILGIFFWKDLTNRVSSTDNGPCVVSWELLDSNDAVIAGSDATINFAKSSSRLSDLDQELKTSINKIASYLKGNSSKSITVVGYYDKDETPSKGTTLRDLALARANVVKSMLTKGGASANQLAVIPKMYDEDNEKNSDCLDDKTLNRGVSFSFGKEKGSE